MIRLHHDRGRTLDGSNNPRDDGEVPKSFSIHRRIQFSETDLAGIVHFSNFFRFMEEVEHAFFRSFGQSIHGVVGENGERLGFPRVHVSCDFRKALFFEEVIEIEIEVKEIKTRTIAYNVNFWKLDLDGIRDELAAEGKLIVACVTIDPSNNKMHAVPLPSTLTKHLNP